MIKIIAATLCLLLAVVLGFITEATIPDLWLNATALSGEKRLPAATEFIYWNFAHWSNGSLFFLFLIPWALIVPYVSSAYQVGSLESGVKFCLGLICFVVGELILFAFIMFCRLLPMMVHWITPIREVPWSAYWPQFLLPIVLLASLMAGWKRRNRRTANGHELTRMWK